MAGSAKGTKMAGERDIRVYLDKCAQLATQRASLLAGLCILLTCGASTACAAGLSGCLLWCCVDLFTGPYMTLLSGWEIDMVAKVLAILLLSIDATLCFM